ncbi:NAD(P)-dependent dehydrogenase (short-subunit alcohol dehydrogenase family) [Nocardioides luteus]|uniref:Short-chain dehydrogenase n=1 Tax=Nocardioides luteus TaxID=1844 RepID=A0ABQ5T0G5_9ACTN|nr:SDR family NAD(P)-dependent oxidoreductase [Nocardioides luteus]MDR7310653.1 NAD(P)-dependent dehydrogenase (short-subunit alcohol dehydrogenase family) [Nocardioides luteus]GGR41507.1 short-chain dehydrogenase [Nocardioides luteus]GLJ69566.1 short-chain dehydrogenase [Nocardioides luteus]
MSTIAVLGAGPGLGMSVAQRFAQEGYDVGLVSRSADRHPGYLEALSANGVRTTAVAADLRAPGEVLRALEAISEELGPIDVVYHGPGAQDLTAASVGILETGPSDVRAAVAEVVEPAAEVASLVLPAMRSRGSGSLIFVSGLSALVPLPFLGPYAPASGALRTYVRTLAAATSDDGVRVGSLVVGGLIERGDIHQMLAGATSYRTLDPDEVADAVWRLASGEEDEVVFDVLTQAPS